MDSRQAAAKTAKNKRKKQVECMTEGGMKWTKHAVLLFLASSRCTSELSGEHNV